MSTRNSRLKFEIDNLVEEALDTIDPSLFESSTTTFIDPSMAGGQFIRGVEKRLRAAGHSDRNINKRVTGIASDPLEAGYAKNRYGLVSDIRLVENIMGENMKKDFTVVLTNPPYEGKKELHQQFFCFSEDICADNGTVVFLQPSTPYLNNKDGKTHQKKMRQLVTTNTTSVSLIPPTVFGESFAQIGNTLALTIMKKDGKGNGRLKQIKFEDGIVYKDVELKHINRNGMTKEVYASLVEKLSNYIGQNGAFSDSIYRNDKGDTNSIARLPRGRGHVGCDDFYTFISDDPSTWTKSIDERASYGVKCATDSEIAYCYSYLRSTVARACLSMEKNSIVLFGSMQYVPLVPFDRIWDDESLCALFGISDEEYADMLRVIPEYHSSRI